MNADLVKQIRDAKLVEGVENDVKRDGPNQYVNVTSSLIKEPASEIKANGELKALEDIGSAAVADEAPTMAKPVPLSEKRVVPNGVANAC